MKEIKGFIIDLLEHENRLHKKALTKNKHALQNPYPVSFLVKVVSMWENEGEKEVAAKASTIEEAMEQAIKKFKAANNRSDVQAYFFVLAHLQNGTVVEIPKKYWGHMQKRMENK